MSDSGTNPEGSRKRKPRGRSKGIRHKPTVIREIHFDAINRPIGNCKNDFASHIGDISRAKVSPKFKTWDDVSDGLKETLWLDVQREFRIPDDPVKRDIVLKSYNEAWKGWKYKLKKHYVDSKPPPDKKMPYEDGRVKKEDWDEFVTYVTSEEFKEKSEKGKQNKSKDEYPHYMGRTSYAQNEIGWKEEGLYDSSAYSSTSTVSSLSARTLNWMRARKKKDDKGNLIVPHEKTREVIENIEEWENKAKSGEFQPYRTDDVLNRALNRKEHSGRALGYGGKSTIRDVFGSSHRSSSYRAAKEINDDLKLKALIREQVALALAAHGIQKTSPEPDVDAMPVDDQIVDMPSRKSSVQSGGVDPFADLQEITKCRLALSIEGEKVIVAYGCVYPKMTLTHHKKVPLHNVAVNIDGIEKGYENVDVPVPNDHIVVLGDAAGSFTQWPKNMVVLDVKQAINPTGQQGKKKKNKVVMKQMS